MLTKVFLDRKFDFFEDLNTTEFNYDSLGNRLSNQFGSSAYDESSQRLMRDFKYDYYYDNNGNLIKKSERVINGNFTNYNYSSENQLIKVSEYKNGNLTKISEYSYDALGRRTKKEIKNFEKLSEFSRKYLYHGQDILAELDESNNTLAVYTHSTLRMDDVLSVDVRSKKFATTEGSYFFLKDDLGSIVDITDSNGTVVQHYSYSAFGRILGIKDGIGNDITGSPLITSHFTYTGRELDSETGLYYYRARYYDAHSGRFMQEDPDPGILEMAATINNKYIYVGNNPLRRIDPTGKSFMDVLKIAVIVTAAAFTGGAAAYALIAYAGATGAAAVAIGIGAGAIAGGLAGGLAGMAFNLATGTGSPGQGFSEGLKIGLVVGAVVGGAVGAGFFGAEADQAYGFFKNLPNLVPAKLTLAAWGAQTIGMQVMSSSKCKKGEQYTLDRGAKGGLGCTPEEEDTYEIPVYTF